jgi:hypothetical protein
MAITPQVYPLMDSHSCYPRTLPVSHYIIFLSSHSIHRSHYLIYTYYFAKNSSFILDLKFLHHLQFLNLMGKYCQGHHLCQNIIFANSINSFLLFLFKFFYLSFSYLVTLAHIICRQIFFCQKLLFVGLLYREHKERGKSLSQGPYKLKYPLWLR